MAPPPGHRGAAPGDSELFGADELPRLREAVTDLSWLLSRGYASSSGLALVGNRYALRERQRLAVGRCACGDQLLQGRLARGMKPGRVRGRTLWLDGYNVLMTIEAALGGGVVLVGRDGCCRDVLGIHGNYHRVHETEPALQLIGEVTGQLGVTACRWWLDKPVSNSGRLKALIEKTAVAKNFNWHVDLDMNPDRALMECPEVVSTADSVILDRCAAWFNLTRTIIATRIPTANLVDLSGEPGGNR